METRKTTGSRRSVYIFVRNLIKSYNLRSDTQSEYVVIFYAPAACFADSGMMAWLGFASWCFFTASKRSHCGRRYTNTSKPTPSWGGYNFEADPADRDEKKQPVLLLILALAGKVTVDRLTALDWQFSSSLTVLVRMLVCCLLQFGYFCWFFCGQDEGGWGFSVFVLRKRGPKWNRVIVGGFARELESDWNGKLGDKLTTFDGDVLFESDRNMCVCVCGRFLWDDVKLELLDKLSNGRVFYGFDGTNFR